MAKSNHLGALAAVAGMLAAVGSLIRRGDSIQLTNNDTPDSQPSYSPDGKKLAYMGFDGTDEEIYTTNVGGGGAFTVTNNDTGDLDPSWGSR
jgi:Tol biopolymer transport system component